MTIQVTYRLTRRLSMRIVKNGDVHVSAPLGLSRKKVEVFIEAHRDWIDKARKRTAEKQERRDAFYNQLPLTTKAQVEEARKRLKLLVEPMVERHAKVMGVSPSKVYFKPMISRWGQCQLKDRSICISTYVLLLPEWCVEHVVVHELCHLLEPSHNARFYKLMDQYFPTWKAARKETRRMIAQFQHHLRRRCRCSHHSNGHTWHMTAGCRPSAKSGGIAYRQIGSDSWDTVLRRRSACYRNCWCR